MKIMIYKSRGSKEFRWRILSTNGKTFANGGESFKRRDHLKKRLAKAFPGMKIVDTTQPEK